MRQNTDSEFQWQPCDKGVTITRYHGKGGSVVIPDSIGGKSVVAVEDWAFSNCGYVTDVTVPYSVRQMGPWVFKNCGSLTQIEVDDRNPVFSSVGGCLCSRDRTKFLRCPEGRSGALRIPPGVVVIQDYALEDCAALTNVTIPDGVTDIGNGAFTGCSRLSEIRCPDSVARIGGWAFSGCERMADFELSARMTEIAEGVFNGCRALRRAVLPDGLTAIGRHAFYNCAALSEALIPDRMELIGERAFAHCADLTRVVLPSALKRICACTFEGCTGLREVVIQTGVTVIDRGAFAGCVSLGRVTVPEGVRQIEARAFIGCRGLTDADLPASLEQIGEDVFSMCGGVTVHAAPGCVAEQYLGEQEPGPALVTLQCPICDEVSSPLPPCDGQNEDGGAVAFGASVISWEDGNGVIVPPKAGQERRVRASYPFSCALGGAFNVAWAPKDATLSDPLQMVECELLDVPLILLSKATIVVRILAVRNMLDFLRPGKTVGSCRFVAHEMEVDSYYEGVKTFGTIDGRGWIVKKWDAQGDCGGEHYIFTDKNGVDHCLARTDWWFDGDVVYFGDLVLGDHEERLAELRRFWLHRAQTVYSPAGSRMDYLRISPLYEYFGTPDILMLLNCSSGASHLNMGREIRETFPDWEPTISYIGSYAISSERLQTVMLPKSVRQIFDYAFAACPRLSMIIVPDGCEFRFETNAFRGCSKKLSFIVTPGSPVIPALKRQGYPVYEWPGNEAARRLAGLPNAAELFPDAVCGRDGMTATLQFEKEG